jgi:hypothetical protein
MEQFSISLNLPCSELSSRCSFTINKQVIVYKGRDCIFTLIREERSYIIIGSKGTSHSDAQLSRVIYDVTITVITHMHIMGVRYLKEVAGEEATSRTYNVNTVEDEY